MQPCSVPNPQRNTPAIEGIIFDLDGTLIDYEGASHIALGRPLQRRGRTFTWELHGSIVGTKPEDWSRTILEATGLLDKLTPQEYVSEYFDEIGGMYAGIPAWPGALLLLKQLRAAGFPLAIATSSPRASFEKKMAFHVEIVTAMTAIVTGDEVQRGKPHPDIFVEAARRLGCDPNRCIVFEDSPAGVAGAQAAGCLVVALPDGRMPGNAGKFAALQPRWLLSSISEFDTSTIRRAPASRRALGGIGAEQGSQFSHAPTPSARPEAIADAYIVAAVRTAGAKVNGALSGFHPVTLGALVLDELLRRAGVADGGMVDDVVVGCVSQCGAQAQNVARNMVLASSRLPECVPGTTIDRQCGSSQQAVHFAAQAVASGHQDVVIAAGVEVMSQVPMFSPIDDARAQGHGVPFERNLNAKYGARLRERGVAWPHDALRTFDQFEGGELVAETFGIDKAEIDEFSLASHAKAVAATDAGHFEREIVRVPVTRRDGGRGGEDAAVVHARDEGIRPDASLSQLQRLPSLRASRSAAKYPGLLTAGNASQLCDGAAAVLVCNEAGLRKLGAQPRARVVALAVAASDPVMMLAGVIPATRAALVRARLCIHDIGLYEVNEAFASVPLAWAKALGADLSRLNVNGGAIALGHPLGATGAKLLTTLLHEMERRCVRYGLLTICEGGGMANATILELCSRPVQVSPRL